MLGLADGNNYYSWPKVIVLVIEALVDLLQYCRRTLELRNICNRTDYLESDE